MLTLLLLLACGSDYEVNKKPDPQPDPIDTSNVDTATDTADTSIDTSEDTSQSVGQPIAVCSVDPVEIDAIYQAGMKAGALGGKLLGAGGGGFMLFFVRPERQEEVKQVLKHLLHVPIGFDQIGSQIIYYSHEDEY